MELYHVLNASQFDRNSLDYICDLVNCIRRISKNKEGSLWLKDLLSNKYAMLYFVQPSTRTFLSFANACDRLGMINYEIRDNRTSSELKGETPEDTVRTFSSYVDMIIMRYPQKGFCDDIAKLLDRTDRSVPVINAGSGSDQHPTQSLLDIYTLVRSFKNRDGIDNKTIVMVGDLLRGRTVRSLSHLMRNYNDVRLIYVAPEEFQIDENMHSFLKEHNINYELEYELEKVVSTADAVYMTRIQDEYGFDESDFEEERNGFIHTKSGIKGRTKEEIGVKLKERLQKKYEKFHFKPEYLRLMKTDSAILHPLPRRNELPASVDSDIRAKYWRQERNGMWVRTALIACILDVDSYIFDYHKRYYS